MQEVSYIGEHLLPGRLGNFFVILSFVSALLAAVSFYISHSRNNDASYLKLGRTAFGFHALAIGGIIITLFLMIFNHYFEYQYVWQHSSRDLPLRYMLSCFWEGQEGSFLLWSFWHVILGVILIRKAGSWEPSVMLVICAVQVFLASMLLGVYFFDYRLGSNPFLLLREHPEFSELPFVKVPDYLRNLDGKGLNPLLQNYWMTIHPPILFLGFAATLVPFAYAVAGLIRKQFGEWIKPALPWTFFGIMILGTGILMGGAWAYESLSFGGFWAWDPVENASLVPWITLVAAGHVMLIYRNRNRSLKTAIILSVLSFILVLYSTFLTRSGILGETSVHAFTDLGMSGQLLVYLLFFLVVPAILFGLNYKKIQSDSDEDSINSREFWIFIAALVLIIAAFQITFTTSIPVFNKVFGTELAPPTEAVEHYNSWQTPLAVLICFILAIAQFFKYKNTSGAELRKKLGPTFIMSAAITIACVIAFEITQVFHILLFFTSSFAALSNTDYFIRVIGGKLSKGGSSIAHVGFALVILGSLISMSKSNVISRNNSGTDLSQLGKDFSNNENIMLAKGDTVEMGDYLVTYREAEQKGIDIYFSIDYLKRTEAGIEKKFTLKPIVQDNPRMGLLAEPSTDHQVHRDIYTHITYAPIKKESEENRSKTIELKPGDTLFTSTSRMIFHGLDRNVDTAKYHLNDSDIAVAAVIGLTDMKGREATARPVYAIRGQYVIPEPAVVSEMGMKINFTGIDIQTGKITLEITESESSKEFIVMKAIIFPGINILWLGAVLMMAGSIVAVIERLRRSKA